MKAIWDINDTIALTTIASHLDMEPDGSPQRQGLHVTETDLITTADIATNALEMRLSDQWRDGALSWSVVFNLSRDVAHEVEFADTRNAGTLFAVEPKPITAGNPVTSAVVLNGNPTIEQRAAFLNTDTFLRISRHSTKATQFGRNLSNQLANLVSNSFF